MPGVLLTRARRGLIVSEPSELLGPIMTCEGGPVRSTDTVAIAGGITLMLLVIMACVVCSQRAAGDDFSKEKPPKREAGMTRLKTTDDDDPLENDEPELSVNYNLGDETPIHGMLPLAGIKSSAELLNELAEFGCELQDEVILSVSMIEVEYEDPLGKAKILGPRTPLSEVIDAGEVTVVSKSTAQKTRFGTNKVINGLRAVSALDDDDDEFDSATARRGSAVAVKVAPRPAGR